MTISAVLETFAVDEKTGIVQTKSLPKNIPLFIPKNTWRFYSYKVLRKGTYIDVNINELVEGDIITLKKGDVVPATIRLMRASSLTVLEDHISGTVAPSHKQTFASKSLAPKSQQKNMLFSGSEVLEGTARGIIVRCAQYDKHAKKHIRSNKLLEKKGIVAQSPHALRQLKKVSVVFFDDLQQEIEIVRLIRHIYQYKHISTVFFVNTTLLKKLKTVFPKEVFSDKGTQGVRIYANVSESDKAKLIAQANRENIESLFVHRGNERSLLPKVATVNMVISPHASQVVLRHADLIAGRLSITKFSSILYNKK